MGKHCFICNKEIVGHGYTVKNQALEIMMFDELGSDNNIICSEECIVEYADLDLVLGESGE